VISQALKKFKNEIGHANHMLITMLVGLDGIVDHDVDARDEFHTSWNPKSKSISVSRSKEFTKKSSLAWLVDCVDMYLRLINQSPSLISDSKLKSDLDSMDNSRSVYKRVFIICGHLSIQTVELAMIDLMICWRNRLVHYQADNEIRKQSLEVLLNNTEKITQDYCGLNISSTISSFSKSSVPSFKEVSSFIRAAISLLYQIDENLLHKLGSVEYADRILIHYLTNVNSASKINNVFSRETETTFSKIKRVLVQNGFNPILPMNVIQYCEKVSALTYIEAKSLIENSRSFLVES